MVLIMEYWNGSVMSGRYDGSGTCDRGSSTVEPWWGKSIDAYPFGALFNHLVAAKTCYVTQSFWNSLTTQERATCRNYAQGIVGTGFFEDYSKTYPWVCSRFVPASIIECFTSACRSLMPDPCAGVVCEDTCIGADKYSQECMTEGENIGECVFDELLEANSPDCPGYVPPEPDPAKGQIVSIDVPASAKEGDSVDLCATIKNMGGVTAKFFLRFYDGSAMVRETLPGNVAAGQTIENVCELFTMPGHAWVGKIELMRQG